MCLCVSMCVRACVSAHVPMFTDDNGGGMVCPFAHTSHNYCGD